MENISIFTIVTPSYNQGVFINDTIASVVKQKGDFYIDYIVMDGGSNDNSLNIIKEWDIRLNCGSSEVVRGKMFFNNNYVNCNGLSFSWVSQKDDGQAAAIKKGFSRGVGDVYAWLNSDDIYIKTDVFTIIKKAFIENPSVEIVTSDGIFIDKDDNEIGEHKVEKINIKELIYLDYHILQPSTFFLKSIYSSEDIESGMVCAFDADFFIKLFLKHNYLKLSYDLSAFRFYEGIKTLSLSDRRYKEAMSIVSKYNTNSLYYLVSRLYRYLEITKKPFLKNRISLKIFKIFRHVSYLIIVRRFGR